MTPCVFDGDYDSAYPPERGIPEESTTKPPVCIVTRMSQIQSKAVSWLWKHRFPRGMLSLLEGDPGCGKSTLLLDLAARVSRGLAMPNNEVGPTNPGSVVVLSAEDGPEAVIRPRLEAAGADLERVVLLDIKTESGTRQPMISEDDILALEAATIDVGAVLFIVDPIVAYLPDGTDSYRDHSVRRALVRLKNLAEHTNAAAIAVRHWTKGSNDKAIHRGGGSIGFTGAARAVHAVALDPDDESGKTRVFAVAKNNLAPLAPSLSYQLLTVPGTDVARVEWAGISQHSANSLSAAPPSRDERLALSEARGFLEDRLKDGSQPTRTIQDAATAHGISQATLKRARESLGIKPYRVGGIASKGAWHWALPGDGNSAEAYT